MTRAPEDVQELEDLALVLYLRPHLAGRRVLWVGGPRPAVVESLESAAEEVRILDRSTRRRSRRSRGPRSSEAPLGLEEGTFDVLLIPDVGLFGGDLDVRLGEIASALGSGSALLGARPRDDDAFEALDARLHDALGGVRWFGQEEVGGSVLARLEDVNHDTVVVDASLQDPEGSPGRVLAVAGALAERLDPYLLVTAGPAASHTARGRGALEQRLEAAEREARTSRRLREDLSEARKMLDQLTAQGPTRVEAEVESLEGKLRAAGHRILELEEEVERRGRLLRDATAAELPTTSAGTVSAPAAPSGGAQLELRGLAGEVDTEEARRLSELERIEAELQGRTRGLRARVAELEEWHASAEAQLALARADMEDARADRRRLEAQLGEAREQFELELVRARMAGAMEEKAREEQSDLEERVAELALSEKHLSGRIGALSGQLMAAQELRLRAESALQSAERGSPGREPRAGASGSGVDVPADARRALGEVAGLRARLRDRQAALAARAAAGSKGGAAVASPGPDMEKLLHALERSALERNELVASVAARDALVSRLQVELASLEHREESSDGRCAQLEEENRRLRDAVVEASGAVDVLEASRQRAAELEGQLVESRAASVELERLAARLTDAERERQEAVRALEETRGILLAVDLAGDAGPHPASGTTSVGVEAPAEVATGWAGPDRPSSEGPGGDSETLLRSLTAQLEVRNDRIQALERMLATRASAPPPGEATERILELEARVERLTGDLGNERRAREEAERSLEEARARGRAADRAAELQRELEDQRSRLEAMRGRAETFERDVDSLRGVCAQARSGLEALLGTATASGNPQLAERIGSVLSVLARY